MDKLFWSFDPVLQSVHGAEPWVVELRHGMEEKLREAIVPLGDYLANFDSYTPFVNLDIAALRASLEAEHAESVNVPALRSLLEQHVSERDAVHETVPERCNIGLFRVKCADVRSFLINKHDEVIQMVLEFAAAKAHQRSKEVPQRQQRPRKPATHDMT